MQEAVPLNRALSKLGIVSRAEATRLIQAGRVQVSGRVVTDARVPVVPERLHLAIDGVRVTRAPWAAVLLNKPRGVVTTRRDPDGRPTVYDVIAGAPAGLSAVGRLDLASSGLLLLTNDTRLAAWVTDPAHHVPRVYTVTVRGEVSDEARERLTAGIDTARERLGADAVIVRKRSRRETHLVVRLHTGRNREVRRLFEAVGHEVTRLRRVAFGGLDLGDLPSGHWRALAPEELRRAFPGAPVGPLFSRSRRWPANVADVQASAPHTHDPRQRGAAAVDGGRPAADGDSPLRAQCRSTPARPASRWTPRESATPRRTVRGTDG